MKYLWLFGALLVWGGTACKSENNCAKAASKLRGCGLLEKGDTGCDEEIPADQAKAASCWSGCLLQASCGQLEKYLCEDEENAVSTCTDSCINASAVFDCGDGSEAATYSKCDGFDDCENGADERGCKTIACKTGGDRFVEAVKCDGFDDCEDGSDELGCPQFKCRSGEMIALQFKCDGDEDCRDASDELGCQSEADLICKGDVSGALKTP